MAAFIAPILGRIAAGAAGRMAAGTATRAAAGTTARAASGATARAAAGSASGASARGAAGAASRASSAGRMDRMVAGISKPRTIGGMVETPGGVGTGGFAFDPARLAHKVLDLGSAVARQQGVGMSGNNAGEVRGLNSAPFQAGGAPNAAPSPDRGAVGRFWSEQMALGAGPSGAGALAPGGGPPGALGPGSAGEIGPAPKAIGTGPKALPPGPMSYTAGGFGGYPPQPPSAPSMIRRGGGGGGRPGGSAAAGIPSAVRT